MSTTAPSKRDVSSVAPRAYESLLDSEQSLLQLLQAVRGSSMNNESKLSLRDMVLEYSATSDSTEKADLKSKISAVLSENSKDFMSLVGRRLHPTEGERTVPATKLESTPAQRSVSMGRVRPKPSFGQPRVQSTPTPEKTVEEKPVEPPKPAEPEPKPVEKESEPVPPSAPAPKEPAPTPPPAETAPAPQPVAPKTNADMMTRINEIKHAVNGHVGNPINLVSVNREVGQEYMASLLDAMKKASSGLASESDVAMSRLETAYQAVDKLIQENPDLSKAKSASPKAKPTPPPVSSTTPSTPTPPVKPVETKVEPPTPATSPTPPPPPKPAVEEKAPEPTPAPKPKMQEGLYHKPEDNVLYKDLPEDVAVELTKKPLTKDEQPATTPVPKTAESKPEEKPKRSLIKSLADGLLFGKGDKNPAPDAKPEPKEDKAVEVTPKPAESPKPPVAPASATPPSPAKPATPPTTPKPTEKESTPLKSVANTTKLPEKITALKESMAKKEDESKKPISGLDAPEVTAGLEQLLSEWKLFKSSGWLGTGPGGVNHPLYKQIATLPMAAVVSGRFEGVTPEIKQSITAYMNGWRYEQGIVHQMGETFENYLRRVILQILDKQRTMNKVKEEAKAEAESQK